ncbi:hypothetical protein KP509_32G024900 [Ceratopteris richardii]|uniref:Protein JASON n=1 Tax=Ceratopteris richardii TaxID=49495 RepID=A0A8T2QSG5_CERRI|nr:hypothetical protein KP509_32G024900 [Ceratopteris richardii]
MGWIINCFKCAGKPDGTTTKKKLFGGTSATSGRSNSAAVAHAASPEDLHNIWKLHPDSIPSSAGEQTEKEHNDISSLSLQNQIKTKKAARRRLKQDEDRVWPRENDSDGELESLKERLMQDVKAANQHSNEFSRERHVPESPSDVIFEKNVQDTGLKVGNAQHSCLSSSECIGRVIEACSLRSDPAFHLCGTGSLTDRCESNDFDNFGDNNTLKCAELSLFRVESGVCDASIDGIRESLQMTSFKSSRQQQSDALTSGCEVPSFRWTFSSVKENLKSFQDFDASDDLLQEHLDVSSLIEDSALITNWELHSVSSFPETWELDGQIHQERRKLQFKLEPSGFGLQEHLHNRDDVIPLSGRPILVGGKNSESKRGLSFKDNSCFMKGTWSKGTFFQDCRGDNAAGAEASNNDSAMQNQFSSKSLLSKCIENSMLKDLHEGALGEHDHFQHDSNTKAQHLPLPQQSMVILRETANEDDRHPLLDGISEEKISNSDAVGHEKSNIYLDALSSSSGSCALEKEDGEQEKKIEISDCFLYSEVKEVMLIEVEDDDQVPLLDATTDDGDVLNDGGSHESSLEAKSENLCEGNNATANHVVDEATSQKASDHLSNVETLPSVSNHHRPARLVEDRPILGTVAAHWSPITTRKWWDGKGIPNSTKKYQEDQKVNWHAVPFEVRLEQELAKQDIVT